MLHFPSYNEFLSEHGGNHHPLIAGLVMFAIVAVGVVFFL